MADPQQVEAADPSQPERRLVQLLQYEDEVAQRLIEALQAMRERHRAISDALAGGARISRFMTIEGMTGREQLRTLAAELVSAVSQVRAAVIRELIDEEGMSHKAVARLIGHPRQLVKRLYDGG
jgi:hypothetical protein